MNDVRIVKNMKIHYLDNTRSYKTISEARAAYEKHLMMEIIDVAAIMDKLGLDGHRENQGLKEPRFIFIEILKDLGFKAYNGSPIYYQYYLRLLERIPHSEIQEMIDAKADTYRNDQILNFLMRNDQSSRYKV